MNINELNKNDWIREYGSGTLQYAHRYNCATESLYLEERVAFAFGGAFQIAPKSRITMGIPMAEGNCHAFTEGIWQIRRRIKMCYTPDYMYNGPQWIIYHNDKDKEEGLGLEIYSYAYEWIPKNNIIFAIVSPAINGKYTGQVHNL